MSTRATELHVQRKSCDYQNRSISCIQIFSFLTFLCMTQEEKALAKAIKASKSTVVRSMVIGYLKIFMTADEEIF